MLVAGRVSISSTNTIGYNWFDFEVDSSLVAKRPLFAYVFGEGCSSLGSKFLDDIKMPGIPGSSEVPN